MGVSSHAGRHCPHFPPIQLPYYELTHPSCSTRTSAALYRHICATSQMHGLGYDQPVNDLWSPAREQARAAARPLALRIRPRTLDQIVGQVHILGKPDSGEKTLLRRMIESGALTSILLHGPPGTGKTTLAAVIAHATKRRFIAENAANVSVKRIREIIAGAGLDLEDSGRRTILFLDEIHRFSRAQQDVLLEDVESGLITLIGATTENPMFAVNSALVSRSTVFRLELLSVADVDTVIRRAIADPERGFGNLNLQVDDDAIEHWATMSDGDARRALNALEVAVLSSDTGQRPVLPTAEPPQIHIDLADAEQSIQRKAIVYDGTGDQHYDTISAFIKSIRGSDPDAAVYWLALMLEAGEDPRFIARRLAILASEDIGNADPRAITVAESTWQLVERIGMPECRITLSQCTTYLALAPKSNAAYMAIEHAAEDVREGTTVPVPLMLRDPHKIDSKGSEKHGKGYEYSHGSDIRAEIGGVTSQDYLGVDRRYYEPLNVGEEVAHRRRLKELDKLRSKGDQDKQQ